MTAWLVRQLLKLERPYRWPILRGAFLLYWRWREREVGLETTGPGTHALPGYTYGKVTGTSPDLLVMTETSESPWVCCGYCSAAMVVRAVKPTKGNSMSSTAHPIRASSGRPHNNGSRASELRAGAKAAHGVTLEALARAEVPERLRLGYAVVVNVDYDELPDWFRVQGGSFGHSLGLYGWADSGSKVGAFDPLWPNGARGAWLPWDQLKPALWADGEHSGTVVRYASAPDPEPVPPKPPEHPPPPPDPTYLEGYAAGVGMGQLVAADDGLGAWLEWYGAPRPAPVDRWDVGSWTDLGAEDPAADPCEPGDPARWSRGRLPSPARDASAALTSSATWGGSSWAAALWRGPDVDEPPAARLGRS